MYLAGRSYKDNYDYSRQVYEKLRFGRLPSYPNNYSTLEIRSRFGRLACQGESGYGSSILNGRGTRRSSCDSYFPFR